MKIHFLIPFLIILITLPACNFKEREAELQKKTDELVQKEQELILWEKTLKLKEDSIKLLIARSDSSSFADSIALPPQQILGEWTAKMVCTQTACPNSAIGDVQTDTWQITTQDSALVIKSIAKGQVQRVYTGNYFQGNTIRVSDQSDVNTGAEKTIRLVEITEIRENKMKGTRVVTQPGGCQITYSLEMDKKLQ